MTPKYSTTDVSRSVTSTILWATLYALVVHYIFALFEYEGVVPGSRSKLFLLLKLFAGIDYELLAGELKDWSAVEIWFGDERAVGAEDPESNYRMLTETLMAAGGPDRRASTAARVSWEPRLRRVRTESFSLRACRWAPTTSRCLTLRSRGSGRTVTQPRFSRTTPALMQRGSARRYITRPSHRRTGSR